MEGPAKHSRQAALFHYPAGVHYDHAIGKASQQRRIVSNKDECCSKLLLEVAQQRDDLCLDRHVQRSGGLVGDHQFGPAGQRLRNGHAMQFSSTELMRIRRIHPLQRQLDLSQDRLGLLFACLAAEVCDGQR